MRRLHRSAIGSSETTFSVLFECELENVHRLDVAATAALTANCRPTEGSRCWCTGSSSSSQPNDLPLGLASGEAALGKAAVALFRRSVHTPPKTAEPQPECNGIPPHPMRSNGGAKGQREFGFLERKSGGSRRQLCSGPSRPVVRMRRGPFINDRCNKRRGFAKKHHPRNASSAGGR